MVEPKYPGVVEQYVNLGDCYDRTSLAPLRSQIMDCMKDYKSCYQRAYRCLNAASQVDADARSILLTDELHDRLEKRALGILSREIPHQKSILPGPVRQRFLSAVSHKGRMVLFDTVKAQCSRVYELSDRYGLAHPLLCFLLAEITAAGFGVVACPSPLAPDRLEHLLVPQLGLAFVSSSPALPYPDKAYRRLRLDSMADAELLRRIKARLRFACRMADSLTEEAVASLAQAKAMHDTLESLYNPHVDFDRVNHTADALCRQLFG